MRVKVNALVVALGTALPLAAAVPVQAATDGTGGTGGTGVTASTQPTGQAAPTLPRMAQAAPAQAAPTQAMPQAAPAQMMPQAAPAQTTAQAASAHAMPQAGPAEPIAPAVQPGGVAGRPGIVRTAAEEAGLTRVVSGQVGVARAAAGEVGFAKAVMGRAGAGLGQATTGLASPTSTTGLAAHLRAAAGPRGPVQRAVRGISAEVTRARGVLGQHTADQAPRADLQRGMYGPGADVVFTYDSPQISDDANHVTWHWSLVNKGTGTASHVILVHRFNRPLDKIKASAPCDVAGKVVRCRFESVPAGGRQEGTIEGDIPSDVSGTVQISGRITWQQEANSTKPGTGLHSMPSAPVAGQTHN